jgi:D-3-phosphoglycerate dehydrogenase
MLASLDAGHAHAYVSDFPTPATFRHPKCVTTPHLGASTSEAEDNCAVMVADQVRDFLEHGQVHHAVNFPELITVRQSAHRSVCVFAASDQASSRVADALSASGISVAGLSGATRGDVSVVVADTATALTEDARARLHALDGVLSIRVLPA